MELLSTNEVKEKYGLSRQWLWILKLQGKIKATQKIVSGRTMNFYKEADIEKIKEKKP
jgi:hypothetical protein